MNNRINLVLSVARDSDIRKTTNGEVTNIGLYNFRFKEPVPFEGGLFCQKIFGPIKDYTCACGARKGGKTVDGKAPSCEICGVDLVKSEVRSKREGYIDAKVHYVNAYAMPLLGAILQIGEGNIEGICNGTMYFRFKESMNGLRSMSGKFYSIELSKEDKTWGTSAEELLDAIQDLDLDSAYIMKNCNSRDVNRYHDKGYTISDFFCSHVRVSPPRTRDMSVVNKDISFHPVNNIYARIVRIGARVATLTNQILEYDGELNLEQLKQVIRGESIVLQALIDALLFKGATDYRGNEIPSVISSLGGKEGIVRGNLLGKRVDFSGRSVIISGPELPLDTIGVPWKMMYELLKPFILNKLIEHLEDLDGILTSQTLKKARTMYANKSTEAMMFMRELADRHWAFLNRAPSLHRYSVMAFKIQLHSGKAIKLPPMLCSPFNAD